MGKFLNSRKKQYPVEISPIYQAIQGFDNSPIRSGALNASLFEHLLASIEHLRILYQKEA